MSRPLAALLLFACMPGFAQLIDRACVIDQINNVRERLRTSAAVLPSSELRKFQSRQDAFESKRHELEREARAVEAAHSAAYERAKAQVLSRRPGIAESSDAFARALVGTLARDRAYDEANAKALNLAVRGFNETEGHQLELLKSIPRESPELQQRMQRMREGFAGTETAALAQSSAFAQLVAMGASARRVQERREPDDWMITVVPPRSTPLETQVRARGLGFDDRLEADIVAVTALLGRFRAREERMALDMTALPSLLPPAALRQEWARPRTDVMPQSRAEAAFAAARIVMDERVVRPKNVALARTAPPPLPEISSHAPAESASAVRRWVGQAKVMVETVKTVLDEIELH